MTAVMHIYIASRSINRTGLYHLAGSHGSWLDRRLWSCLTSFILLLLLLPVLVLLLIVTENNFNTKTVTIIITIVAMSLSVLKIRWKIQMWKISFQTFHLNLSSEFYGKHHKKPFSSDWFLKLFYTFTILLILDSGSELIWMVRSP